MPDKVTLANVATFQNDTSAVAAINNNNALITTALDNTLSRDGTVPNAMGANLDMNNNQILNLPSPATVNSPARLVDVVTNPTVVVPPVGIAGSTVPLLNAANTWSGVQTFSINPVFNVSSIPVAALVAGSFPSLTANNTHTTSRQIFNYTPVYDLASSVLATSISIPLNATTQTVAANNQFNYIRLSQINGSDVTFTVGVNGLAEGIYSSLTSGSGSDATSNVYGMVSQVTNAGPGTAKGIHTAAIASGTTTGNLVAANMQIQPAATTVTAWGGFSSLTSSGVNDKAVGFGIESSGDRYSIAVGNVVAALPVGTAFYRAWMSSASSTNARAFQVSNNAGTEISYIHKDGTAQIPNIGRYYLIVRGVNFNSATTDTSIPVTLPPGVSNYNITVIRIANASGALSTATAGLFTAAAGGGVAIATLQAPTVTTSSANTNNNSEVMALNNANTQSYNASTLFFRIGTAQGSAATADVLIEIAPL